MGIKNGSKYSKNGILVAIACAAVYLTLSERGWVSPALNSLSTTYPGSGMTEISLVMTIVSIASLPIALLAGYIVGTKLSYRNTALIGLGLMTIGGGAPFFFASPGSSFELLLVFRCIFGVGLGFTSAIMGVLPVVLFSNQDDQNKVLGYGATGMAVMTIVGPMLVAWLLTFGAKNDTRYIWILLGLFSLIAFILALFLPKVPLEKKIISNEERKKKGRITPVAWYYVILFPLASMVCGMIFLVTSTIIAEEGMGGATEAGLVITLFGVGIAIGGLLVPFFIKVFKKFSVGIGCLICVLALMMLALGDLIVMYVAAVILGVALMGIVQPTCFSIIGNECSPTGAARANGLTATFLGLTGFLMTYFMVACQTVSGMESYRVSFIGAAIVMVLLGIVCFILVPKMKAFGESSKTAGANKSELADNVDNQI